MQTISLKKAFEFAVKLEKSGGYFYREAAKNSRNKDVSELFLFLAVEEDRHLKTVRLMAEKASAQDSETMQDDGGIGKIIDAYATAFFQGQEDADEHPVKKMPIGEAIDFAIKMERNAIEYYKKLRSLVSEKDRRAINVILEEENRHFEKFSRMKGVIERGSDS